MRDCLLFIVGWFLGGVVGWGLATARNITTLKNLAGLEDDQILSFVKQWRWW
jgi:hypothetical protein